jgi:hypothetical protein
VKEVDGMHQAKLGNLDESRRHAMLITRTVLSRMFGVLSIAILVHIWLVFSAPIKWNLRYPGGSASVLVALLLCFGMSFLAARWGGSKWYLLTIFAVITFIYVGWFYRPPMWN